MLIEKNRRLRYFGMTVVIGLISLGVSSAANTLPPLHEMENIPRYQSKMFEKLLDDQLIVSDQRRDQSVIYNQNYLAQHPEPHRVLETHSALKKKVAAMTEHCSQSIPSIFDRVSPAVVFIYATSINPYRTTDRVEHIVGSGFIVDASGLVLTNSHVAFDRQSLIVVLDDGTSLPAKLVGADPIFDIALLRIPAPENETIPTVTLGDSDRIHVGDESLAIGNPLGLDQSLTRGIVSAINRILPVTFFSLREPLIQIDTPINPGNSGGPLLNACGEVIGITTAIIPDAHNIGFAVPINLAKAVIPSLLANGHLVRPWLGFHGQFVDRDLQVLLRIPLDVGFLVEVVEPGSPAAQSGLRGGELELTIATRDFLLGGDIITKINGRQLTSTDDVLEALQELKVGDTVNLTVFRESKYLEVKYTLPERPILPGDIPSQSVDTPLTGSSAIRNLLHDSSLRF